MAENFGQGVTKSDANQYFKQFYEIKKRSQEALKEALKGDKQALRYYCGKGRKGENSDWAFVFDMESLKRILAKIKKHRGNCAFIFNGAKKDGSPTVMILPSTYREVEAKMKKDQFAFTIHTDSPGKKSKAAMSKAVGSVPSAGVADGEDDAGEQHPGSGGGEFKAGQEIAIPQGFYEGQYRV